MENVENNQVTNDETKQLNEISKDDVYNFLITIQKIVRYFIQSGLVIGSIGYLNNIDNILEIVLYSSSIIGLLVGIVNILKVKFKIKHKFKWLPLG